MYDVIYAVDEAGGLGRNGTIPWLATPAGRADLKFFRRKTIGHVCIVGRRTAETLPPLKFREVVVVSGCTPAEALQQFPGEKKFIIGGAMLIRQALDGIPGWRLNKVYVTTIPGKWDCDVFAPLPNLPVYKTRGPVTIYRASEYQYLDLIETALDGTHKTGTLSIFGARMEFDMAGGFPLLTTKRVFWRGVVEELLWFLRGDTNAGNLAARGVHIWDHNAAPEYLARRGLHYPPGELGPIYGHQWRRWGYDSKTGIGVDQITAVIDGLKNNPHSRRHVVSAWNPTDIPLMALPPCHVLFQFYFDGRLHLQLYQRSGDIGLGIPFNIASYALLLHLIAAECDMVPGRFIHIIGDAHIYDEHVDGLRTQLTREPRAQPKLTFTKKPLGDYTFEDFHLEGYNPHPKIDLPFVDRN